MEWSTNGQDLVLEPCEPMLFLSIKNSSISRSSTIVVGDIRHYNVRVVVALVVSVIVIILNLRIGVVDFFSDLIWFHLKQLKNQKLK
jgi:hypothetical protein